MNGGDAAAAHRAALAAAVQRNCDRADAAHAQELSLCVYLLQMREFFRWERALPLGDAPDRAEVGRWIAAREARWDALDAAAHAGHAGFEPLPLSGGIDPFDESAANEALAPLGLAYGAGLGFMRRPEFVLGEIRSIERRDGATIVVLGQELARGMNPPLAASRGDRVLVRGDVLRRWLATRLELWSQRPRAGEAAGALAEPWRFEGEPGAALERIAVAETGTLILHELGERRAGALLGPQWEAMLTALDDRRAEIVARALRDLIADCESTLPALLARAEHVSLHFWFANLEGMRGLLGGALRAGYRAWCDAGAAPADAPALAAIVRDQREHWLGEARRLLAAFRERGVPGVVHDARELASRVQT